MISLKTGDLAAKDTLVHAIERGTSFDQGGGQRGRGKIMTWLRWYLRHRRRWEEEDDELCPTGTVTAYRDRDSLGGVFTSSAGWTRRFASSNVEVTTHLVTLLVAWLLTPT